MDTLLGLNSQPHDLTILQMTLRACIIFILTLVYIRVTGMRTFGKNNAIDMVIGLILGSVLSRAITGNTAFFPALAEGFALVLLHRFTAYLCYKSHRVGKILKGSPSLIFNNGDMVHEGMKKHNITEHDFIEGVRQTASTEDLSSLEKVYFERTGVISVVKKKTL
jgi:uncharacterized membrane protein YcaP (DUF421 family)